MSKSNRLKLDFSIQSAEERSQFVQEYLNDPIFCAKPPTNSEIETISNYILWGKDENGETVVSQGFVQLETKNGNWTKKHQDQSLDELLEAPTFNEDAIRKPHQAHYKNTKETFSRTAALNSAPDSLKETFLDLFKRIDSTELIVNLYEIKVGKREKPPRKELYKLLSEEEIEQIEHVAAELEEYGYLKKRHYLIELRREQYTLRDSYQTRIKKDTIKRGAPIEDNPVFTFGFDSVVLPLGLFSEQPTAKLIFKPLNQLNPTSFSDGELRKISKLIWEQEKEDTTLAFDFRELEHVYQLFQIYVDLRESESLNHYNSTTKFLFDTLDYYMELAQLSEVQKKILELKVQKVKNSDIAAFINREFDKSYTDNYISTIFRQKIIKQINDVAAYHHKIVSNLFFEEEFKACNKCGEIKLICAENFVRKSRSKDGFTNRCKCCDRNERISKKEK